MAVLYRKYRPQKLTEIVGQEAIVSTLLSQLESGRIGHGYLFCGPRGTGKTSMARIFAKAVNCEVYGSSLTAYRDEKKKAINNQRSVTSHFGEPCNKCSNCKSISDGSNLDLIEIDAASNRGIDEIRDLREKIKLSPVFCRFKVYIIDEAHMLTKEAFNALLKTLEEPPAHAIFILATTEAGKLPATIISRLSKFNFQRASVENLTRSLIAIAAAEKIKLEKEAAVVISSSADGSYRDAISVLDQFASRGEVKLADVSVLVSVVGWSQLLDFCRKLADHDLKNAVLTIEKIVKNGGDIDLFGRELILFLERLLFIKIGAYESEGMVADQKEEITKLADLFTSVELQELMKLFLIAEGEIRIYPLPQIPLVLAVCKYIGGREEVLEAKDVEEPKETKVSNEKVIDVIRKEQDDLKNPVQGKEIKPPGGSASGKTRSLGKFKSMDDIDAKWSEFLTRVRMKNAHVVALLRSTRKLSLDEDILTLEVFYKFHKQKLEEPKIIAMLDTIMEETFGELLKLKFVLAQRSVVQPEVVKRSDVAEITAGNLEDLEKIAHEIFSE